MIYQPHITRERQGRQAATVAAAICSEDGRRTRELRVLEGVADTLWRAKQDLDAARNEYHSALLIPEDASQTIAEHARRAELALAGGAMQGVIDLTLIHLESSWQTLVGVVGTGVSEGMAEADTAEETLPTEDVCAGGREEIL
jgi:hypothetical protein